MITYVSKNVALVASVGLNIGLSMALLAGQFGLPSWGLDVSKEITTKATRYGNVLNLGDVTASSYYQSLLKKNLTASERAALLVAHLHATYKSKLPQYQYWRGSDEAAISAAVMEQTRVDILAAVGQGTSDDKSYGIIFRPLQREFPELAPAKQVVIQRSLQVYYQSVGQKLSTADPLSRGDVLYSSYAGLNAGLSSELTPSEYEEYLIRVSPLADSIRRMRLGINEKQYRGLVQFVDTDEHLTRLMIGGGGGRAALKLYGTELVDLLGYERYLKFLSAVDPIYSTMLALGAQNGIPTERVNAVYSRFVANQQQGERGVVADGDRERDSLAVLGPTAKLAVEQLMSAAAPG